MTTRTGAKPLSARRSASGRRSEFRAPKTTIASACRGVDVLGHTKRRAVAPAKATTTTTTATIRPQVRIVVADIGPDVLQSRGAIQTLRPRLASPDPGQRERESAECRRPPAGTVGASFGGTTPSNALEWESNRSGISGAASHRSGVSGRGSFHRRKTSSPLWARTPTRTSCFVA